MVTVKDFDSLHNIYPGRHLYQFYKNVDDFLFVMLPYFKAGLQKNQACLWLVSAKNGLSAVRHASLTHIQNCETYFISGQLKIRSAEEWYLSNGSFDEAKALSNAENHLRWMREEKYSELRAAGDLGCISRKDWPLVDEYEKKANAIVKSNAIVGLCAYPILECTPSQTKDILELHEDVLVGQL